MAVPAKAATISSDPVGEKLRALLKAATWLSQLVTSQWT
jgi:hypothetical protein